MRRIRRVFRIPPDSIKGPIITVKIPPEDDPTTLLDLGSICLLFDFKPNGNSCFLNNLPKLLIKRLVVQLNDDIIFDNRSESSFNIYKDLWKTTGERAESSKLNERLAKGVREQNFQWEGLKVNIGSAFGGNKVSSPYQGISYTVALASPSEIAIGKTTTYKLERVIAEYDVVTCNRVFPNLNNVISFNEIWSCYGKGGRAIKKTAITIHDQLSLSSDRKLSAVVFLFNELIQKTDSENYIYPNIESVVINRSEPTRVSYERVILKDEFFEEARKVFGHISEDQSMTNERFYKNGFALVIRLKKEEQDDSYKSHITFKINKGKTKENIIYKMFTVNSRCNLSMC